MTHNFSSQKKSAALLLLRHRLLALVGSSSLLAVAYACGGSDSDNITTTAAGGGSDSDNITTTAAGAGGSEPTESAGCRVDGIPRFGSPQPNSTPSIPTELNGFLSLEEANLACPSSCGLFKKIIATNKDPVPKTTWSCNCRGPFCTEDQAVVACEKEKFCTRDSDLLTGEEGRDSGWYCPEICSNNLGGRPLVHAGAALLAALVTRRDWFSLEKRQANRIALVSRREGSLA